MSKRLCYRLFWVYARKPTGSKAKNGSSDENLRRQGEGISDLYLIHGSSATSNPFGFECSLSALARPISVPERHQYDHFEPAEDLGAGDQAQRSGGRGRSRWAMPTPLHIPHTAIPKQSSPACQAPFPWAGVLDAHKELSDF